MKSWEQRAEKIQPERDMPDLERQEYSPVKTGKSPEARELRQKQEEVKKRRREKFYSSLIRRLTALATAGFITLGGSFKDARVKSSHKTERETASIEFVSERQGIGDEVLADFEKKLRAGEPYFIEWLTNYEEGLIKELDEYEEKLLNEKYEQNLDIELLRSLWGSSEINKRENRILIFEESGPRVKEFFASNTDKIKKYHTIIRENLHNIILAGFLLDDSREVRDNVLLYNRIPPRISFHLYHPYDFLIGLTGHSSPVSPNLEDEYLQGKKKIEPGENLRPEIIITSTAMMRNYEKRSEFDLNSYFSTLIHEILHALKYGTKDTKILLNASGIEKFLLEGLTQYHSFEILKFLASRDGELKVSIDSFYDHVLVTVILDSILRSNGSFAVSLINSRLTDDQYFLNRLRSSIKRLGLAEDIINDIKRLNDDNFTSGQDHTLIIAADLLARLNLNDVRILEEFVESVLASKHSSDIEFQEIIRKTKDWLALAKQREKTFKQREQ